MSTPTTAATEPDPVPADAPATAEATGKSAATLAGRSPGQLAWARFKRDKAGIACAIVIALFLLVALFAPLITKLYGKDAYTFYGQDDNLLDSYGLPLGANGGVSVHHWFGVEPDLGRDVFSLLIYGIRTSLGIALCVTVLSVAAGVLIGLAQAYIGGKTDFLLGRVSDLLMAFPQQLFFVAFTPVVISLFVGARQAESTTLRFFALVLVQFLLGWMAMGRLVRAQVVSLRDRDFVEAARLSGASSWRIITKELLPNTWSTILVQATLLLPVNVTAEAGLSFLGVGMRNPTPDWGVMFSTASDYYRSDITYLIFPGIAMLIFVVAFNLLGDSVRDALDPKTTR
jgi:peptide/nickel transport system permease protein